MAHKRTRGLARLFFGAVPNDQIQRAYRIRVPLFFVLVVIMVVVLFLVYQLAQTLHQLSLAEGKRDQWQRPDDVIGVPLANRQKTTLSQTGVGPS
jgi:hypothetical protein